MKKERPFNQLIPGSPEYERRVAVGNLLVLEKSIRVREEWLERASELIPLKGAEGVIRAQKIQDDIEELREEVRYNEQRLRDNPRRMGEIA